MSAWFQAHDGLVTAAQLLLWALLCASAAPAAWRVLREQVAGRSLGILLVLAVVGAALPLLVFPTERWIGLGHSASYEAVFRGVQSPSFAQEQWEAYVTYPLLRWVYWAVGGLVGREDPGVLLALNAGLRGMGVLGVGLLAALWARRDAVGVAAASLLLLLPTHALWGAEIFNVAGPYAAAAFCVVLALLAWRSGSARVFAAAAATGALSVAGRVEWALLAPALTLVLLTLGERWGRSAEARTLRFWGPAVAVSALYVASLVLGGGDLTSQGGYHGPLGYLSLVLRQAFLPDFLVPFDLPGAVLIPVLGAIALVRAGRVEARAAVGLGGAFAVLHFGLHTFNDSGFRHELMPGMFALTAAAGLVVVALPRDGAPGAAARVGAAALLAGVLLRGAWELPSWAERYFEEPEAFQRRHPGFRGPELSSASLESTGCYLITDNERLWDLGLAGSHFNLSDPEEAARRWDEHDGCIVWLFDPPNVRVDGLSVPDRARKLFRWFRWSEQGWARFEDGTPAVLYRMVEPPRGASARARPVAVQSAR